MDYTAGTSTWQPNLKLEEPVDDGPHDQPEAQQPQRDLPEIRTGVQDLPEPVLGFHGLEMEVGGDSLGRERLPAGSGKIAAAR